MVFLTTAFSFHFICPLSLSEVFELRSFLFVSPVSMPKVLLLFYLCTYTVSCPPPLFPSAVFPIIKPLSPALSHHFSLLYSPLIFPRFLLLYYFWWFYESLSFLPREGIESMLV